MFSGISRVSASKILGLNKFALRTLNMLRFLVRKHMHTLVISKTIVCNFLDLQISLSIGVYAGIYIAQNYEVRTSDKIRNVLATLIGLYMKKIYIFEFYLVIRRIHCLSFKLKFKLKII